MGLNNLPYEFAHNNVVHSATGGTPFSIVTVRLIIRASHKLKQRKCGPFKITKKINHNAYVVDLHWMGNISRTFNVANLDNYLPDCWLGYPDHNLRLSSLPVEVIDGVSGELRCSLEPSPLAVSPLLKKRHITRLQFHGRVYDRVSSFV
ncbi:hypothetical protein GH714_032090 [Hevea brasiliensis]|uniref:Tf2-1-like SH3-like domain-containing protein n=1 Tax=Hevea brasiliensis TaxID=3981 RepID=A0A6A6LHJ4_HEVBR|nr:hypothetical protein GH714_032090 [Hevea brasiliensis]